MGKAFIFAPQSIAFQAPENAVFCRNHINSFLSMVKRVQQSQPALGADLKRLCNLAGCGWCESGSKQTAKSTVWALRGLSAEDLLDEGLRGELFSFFQ
jgi:hypothetical protein